MTVVRITSKYPVAHELRIPFPIISTFRLFQKDEWMFSAVESITFQESYEYISVKYGLTLMIESICMLYVIRFGEFLRPAVDERVFHFFPDSLRCFACFCVKSKLIHRDASAGPKYICT